MELWLWWTILSLLRSAVLFVADILCNTLPHTVTCQKETHLKWSLPRESLVSDIFWNTLPHTVTCQKEAHLMPSLLRESLVSDILSIILPHPVTCQKETISSMWEPGFDALIGWLILHRTCFLLIVRTSGHNITTFVDSYLSDKHSAGDHFRKKSTTVSASPVKLYFGSAGLRLKTYYRICTYWGLICKRYLSDWWLSWAIFCSVYLWHCPSLVLRNKFRFGSKFTRLL